MGKTVKSRLFISVTSIICVVVFCIIANSGIPALWESYATKAAAEEAATATVAHVVKPTTTTTTEAPATEATEASEVYEIEETQAPETTVSTEEPTTEEVTEEETTTEPAASSGEEGFLDKIINFLTSIFDMIFSGDLLSKIGDLFSGVLGIFGL